MRESSLSDLDNSAAGGYAIYCGLDVGKSEHHACALDPAGKKIYDKPLPNDEAALTGVLTGLAARGRVLVIIDQPAAIGALVIAVARHLGIEVAYLPGLAMRRIGTDDETLAGLGVLAGYDDDLAAQSTRLTNRLREAILHIHPALERLLGKHFDRPGVLELLAAAPTPTALRELGADGMTAVMRTRSPRLAKTLPAKILAALDAQTVHVPGTAEFGRVIAGTAAQLRDILLERAKLGADLEARLEAHPLTAILTTMPGVGSRTAVKILTIVGDGSAFPTAGHLAAYAGLAPVTRRSGTSIKGESRSHRGNHALKSALFLSAFASLKDPASRAYYDRKRAEKKRHNAALICLARRRVDVLFAMLRDGTPYQRPTRAEPNQATTAA